MQRILSSLDHDLVPLGAADSPESRLRLELFLRKLRGPKDAPLTEVGRPPPDPPLVELATSSAAATR